MRPGFTSLAWSIGGAVPCHMGCLLALGLASLTVRAQEPLETRAMGRFEASVRLEPVRPLPGEDLFLWVSIQAVAPYRKGPRPLGLEELASDPRSGFSGKFRIQPLEVDGPPPEPEAGVGPPATTWVFGYRLIPLKDARGDYPGEIPEFGLVTTRDDIPWPRLARQIVWIGPLALRYAEQSDRESPSLTTEKGSVLWFLFWPFIPLLWAVLYESRKWHRDVTQARTQIFAADGASPLVLRKGMLEWLRARGVHLSAEPLPERIEAAVRRAGYPANLASQSRQLWERLNAAAFGPTTDASIDLARACSAWTASWGWVPWKRRIIIRPE